MRNRNDGATVIAESGEPFLRLAMHDWLLLVSSPIFAITNICIQILAFLSPNDFRMATLSAKALLACRDKGRDRGFYSEILKRSSLFFYQIPVCRLSGNIFENSRSLSVFKAHEKCVRYVKFVHQGTRIVSWNADTSWHILRNNVIKVLDAKTYQCIQEWRVPEKLIDPLDENESVGGRGPWCEVAINPEGTQVATLFNWKLGVYNLQTKKHVLFVHKKDQDQYAGSHAVFSSDGTSIAMMYGGNIRLSHGISEDPYKNPIKLLDAKTGQIKWTSCLPSSATPQYVIDIFFNSTNEYLAIDFTDCFVVLNAFSGDLIKKFDKKILSYFLPHHGTSHDEFCFSQDGKQILSMRYAGLMNVNITCFDVANMKQIHYLEGVKLQNVEGFSYSSGGPESYQHFINILYFSSEHKQIFLERFDCVLEILNSDTGERLAVKRLHSKILSFDVFNKQMIFGFQDGSIQQISFTGLLHNSLPESESVNADSCCSIA